ncbi:hypothetical protein [Fusobacterium necrophorum]|uniref:hypothetical protein n=1 Tax=Fusobacterium necrophorum TaxID=859 RepID=UPI0007893F53|nr:hypothetical protein [Fusobacterium necrophorum]KYM48755.1 hypothetical protein A2U11_11055 [Fusobacterium necrophorum subsp. funduliforme]
MLSVIAPYNNLNIIIRAENNTAEFIRNGNKVNDIVFNIYTHCFSADREFNIKISLLKSRTEVAVKEEVNGFDIDEYKLDKDGFHSLDSGSTGEIVKRKNISLIDGYRADMRLDMSGINLEPAFYEIVVNVDDRVATSYSFVVK